jgi:hypothetical protein
MTMKLLIFLIVSFIGLGCQDKAVQANTSLANDSKFEKKVIPMAQEVSIKVGEIASELQKRYPDKLQIQKQPAGLDFYSIDWDSYPRGKVKIDHGKNSVVIDGVLGIQTHTNVDFPAEGFYVYTIFAGLSEAPTGLISHDEARLKTYALLKKIEQAGWQVITGRNDPRIKGKERFSHVLRKSKYIGLGVDYLPTFEEWMQIEDLTSWNFYANRQYLTVYFKRERTLLDPAKPGSYLITYSLKSEAENFRGYVEPLERKRWKELLPTELAQDKDKRVKAEAALKAQGITIDETYQDPPLPDLK